MRDKYVAECKVIQQNSTYTAEAHHQMALSAKSKAFWFEVFPAVCAAITGTLVASGVVSVRLLPLTVLSAAVSAVAAVLNPNRLYEEHLGAARSFTAIKHDARFLHEVKSSDLTDDAFAILVESLHQKYNELLKAVPPTDTPSFAKAREIVQAGIHEPDRDERGNVK
jgi:hypothetical protein